MVGFVLGVEGQDMYVVPIETAVQGSKELREKVLNKLPALMFQSPLAVHVTDQATQDARIMTVE